ncbi:unnamed protein product [Pleuronectes platessa]|uniref:Uncharacterized protein n=1 Tax=Pleuronectes platessa TaxID=8262 RepID=A0A9N7TT37_PLEPL|nr:unnamed protein product [Pleuronectes platessa]
MWRPGPEDERDLDTAELLLTLSEDSSVFSTLKPWGGRSRNQNTNESFVRSDPHRAAPALLHPRRRTPTGTIPGLERSFPFTAGSVNASSSGSRGTKERVSPSRVQRDVSALSTPTGPNMTAYWVQLPLEGPVQSRLCLGPHARGLMCRNATDAHFENTSPELLKSREPRGNLEV